MARDWSLCHGAFSFKPRPAVCRSGFAANSATTGCREHGDAPDWLGIACRLRVGTPLRAWLPPRRDRIGVDNARNCGQKHRGSQSRRRGQGVLKARGASARDGK